MADHETGRVPVQHPTHHRAHPALLAQAGGKPPPHTLKNKYVHFHFRVHKSTGHSLRDVVDNCLYYSRWTNETLNVLTGAIPCVIGLWLAGSAAVVDTQPEHRWRISVLAAAVFVNGVCTALYHAAASVPAWFVRGSALDLAGIVIVCIGLLACRQIPGMGGGGPWCDGTGFGARGGGAEGLAYIAQWTWRAVCEPGSGGSSDSQFLTASVGILALLVAIVRARLAQEGKTPAWLTAVTCAPYAPLVADYLWRGDERGLGAASLHAADHGAARGWAPPLAAWYRPIATPHAPVVVTTLLLAGLALHLSKVPERFLPPGTVDRLGQSHHLWHAAVSAVFVVYGADAVRAAAAAAGALL